MNWMEQAYIVHTLLPKTHLWTAFAKIVAFSFFGFPKHVTLGPTNPPAVCVIHSGLLRITTQQASIQWSVIYFCICEMCHSIMPLYDMKVSWTLCGLNESVKKGLARWVEWESEKESHGASHRRDNRREVIKIILFDQCDGRIVKVIVQHKSVILK